MTKPDIWYVAFDSAVGSSDAAESDIKKRTFKSEIDAKLFATQILARGWQAYAGTVDDYEPQHEISKSDMKEWAARLSPS